MPTYVYRIVTTDPNAPEQTFELRQSMHDAPLTVHPETGQPVERVICVPQVASPKGNSDIAAAGFTTVSPAAAAAAPAVPTCVRNERRGMSARLAIRPLLEKKSAAKCGTF